LSTKLAIVIVMAALICGCVAANQPASTGPGEAPLSSVLANSPEELAKLACPNPDDLADCRQAIVDAAAAGTPAALCIGPQSDRWNIVTPRAGDSEGSPCGPDDLGKIRGIIVAP